MEAPWTLDLNKQNKNYKKEGSSKLDTVLAHNIDKKKEQ